MGAWESTDVHFADLLLSVSPYEYRPGDVVVWNWLVLGSGAVSHMVYAIWDDDGVKVAGEELTYAPTGSFEFAVPDENPSEDYEAWVWMTSEDGGYAEYSAWAYLVVDAYELMIWPGDSGYTSGEFAPGDTVTLFWSTSGAMVRNRSPVWSEWVKV